jgi:hypothetical protein
MQYGCVRLIGAVSIVTADDAIHRRIIARCLHVHKEARSPCADPLLLRFIRHAVSAPRVQNQSRGFMLGRERHSPAADVRSRLRLQLTNAMRMTAARQVLKRQDPS